MKRWLSDKTGQLRGGPYAVALACLYVLFFGTYVPMNFFSVGRPAYTLFLPGEDRLPFLPVFEYLYVLTFFVPALVIVTVRDYARFTRLVRAFAIVLVVAYTTYLVFPVYFARPRLVVDSLHTWLLSLQYIDKPYNHLPSMHVTLSWLTVWASDVSRRSRIALAIVAIGISISTLFVKQHYLVDVIAGTVLAWASWQLAGRLSLTASQSKSYSAIEPAGLATTSAAE